MPTTAKITKEEIIKVAFEITENYGVDAATATAIAKKLRCSIQPIYYVFINMDNLREAIIEKALEKYSLFLRIEIKGETKLLSLGLNFVNFTIEYPHLFKLLFCSDRQKNKLDANKYYFLELLREEYGVNDESIEEIYQSIEIFLYGIASMISWDIAKFTQSKIKLLINELFVRLLGKSN